MNLFPELNRAIKEHEAELIRYSARLLGDQHSAQDAVQDTFIKYARYKGDYPRAVIENVRAWLYKSARNICIDMLRSKKRSAEILISEDATFAQDENSRPDIIVKKNEEAAMLRKLINKLNQKDREILILKIDHGRSYKEISEITGLTVTNVGFILHNAMTKLKDEFHKTSNQCEQVTEK